MMNTRVVLTSGDSERRRFPDYGEAEAESEILVGEAEALHIPL